MEEKIGVAEIYMASINQSIDIVAKESEFNKFRNEMYDRVREYVKIFDEDAKMLQIFKREMILCAIFTPTIDY